MENVKHFVFDLTFTYLFTYKVKRIGLIVFV